MKQLFFDLETTGLSSYRNGIHQISGAVVIDGAVREYFNYHVRPVQGKVIDPAALEVAGVTEQQVMTYDPARQVYDRFIALLSKYVDRYDKKDKFFLCGYNNAAFDDAFLRQWFVDNGDKYFGSWFWPNPIDVYVLASACPKLMEERPSMENFKLGTVAAALGIEMDPAKLHDASYDIDMTMAIYDKVRLK